MSKEAFNVVGVIDAKERNAELLAELAWLEVKDAVEQYGLPLLALGDGHFVACYAGNWRPIYLAILSLMGECK